MAATTQSGSALPTSITQTSNKTTTAPASILEDYHSGLISLSILIVLCNLFAIQAYTRHEKIRRNCSNVLLISLAISDLIVGLIFLPILIFSENQFLNYSDNKTFIYIVWFNFLLGNFFGFSTIFHIIALTMEKYLAVLHPFQRLSVSARTYRKILIAVWSLALAFALAPLTWLFHEPRSEGWYEKLKIYGIVQAVIFLGIASLILGYCYIRMFIQIHVKLSARTQTGRVRANARNDRKTVLIFLMFFSIFIFGWTPWFFFNLSYLHEKLVSLEVKDFLVSLRFASAVLNPLIYTFIKSDYKQAVQTDMRALCLGCLRPMGFQKLLQTSTLNRGSNNNTARRGTLTTTCSNGDAVKLKKIEPYHAYGETQPGSFTSGASGLHFSSQAEDTDL